ncbi:MAG: N-acetylmuramoyl-L-alanine amidase [bacterium]|nr:N-acetylmuramoyl-L-alanine amidase [bacterium]
MSWLSNAFSTSCIAALCATPAAAGGIRICIDPGHGGSDNGASGFGFLEKEMNLDIALRLRDLLVADTADTFGGGEWEVLMTRTTDATVSLQQRVALANSWPAERFVSIHCNAFSDPAANGTETYSFQEGTTSAALRNEIHSEMIAAWGLTDRGTKTANFYVLVNTSMPATLSEVGFITSPIDIQLISDPDARQEIALAHLFGIQRHYGLAPYEPGFSGPPTQYCVPKVTSGGCVPVITHLGNPTLTGLDDFHVTAHTVMANQFGIFIWAFGPNNQPFFGGTLCVDVPLVRTPVQNSGGSGCLGTFNYFFSQQVMADTFLAPGTVIYGQYWFRDPGFAAPNNVGLTGGLAFRIDP